MFYKKALRSADNPSESAFGRVLLKDNVYEDRQFKLKLGKIDKCAKIKENELLAEKKVFLKLKKAKFVQPSIILWKRKDESNAEKEVPLTTKQIQKLWMSSNNSNVYRNWRYCVYYYKMYGLKTTHIGEKPKNRVYLMNNFGFSQSSLINNKIIFRDEALRNIISNYLSIVKELTNCYLKRTNTNDQRRLSLLILKNQKVDKFNRDIDEKIKKLIFKCDQYKINKYYANNQNLFRHVKNNLNYWLDLYAQRDKTERVESTFFLTHYDQSFYE
ncbi:hypothetical protein A3Q56_08482 [Intoshia linei]|uniref:Uncharacterized protein n=1 Tax=Intoshia linei TaxID=1819745 RepID=A0A177AQL0_9BILA|nr:hypothetical protein A3Q56_08482 [Intoshia linei]